MLEGATALEQPVAISPDCHLPHHPVYVFYPRVARSRLSCDDKRVMTPVCDHTHNIRKTMTLYLGSPVQYLVVVAIGDGIGVNSSLLHLKQDPHCQHRLAVLSTQLHENPVTHLRR